MSYALRNSLILAIVLLLFVAGGWAYIHFYQTGKIESLQMKVESRKKLLSQKQEIANQYEAITDSYNNIRIYFNQYAKALYPSSDEDRVFDFLTRLNEGAARNDFNFSFKDSTLHDKYGVMSVHIEGNGRYEHAINFIRGIELRKPLNKISNVQMQLLKKEGSYQNISYSFDLQSYYYRSQLLQRTSFNAPSLRYTSVYNPFFPLIHGIKPNVNDEINVEKSKLIALSNHRIFLIDQNNKMQQIKIGDKVYLGHLSHINLTNRTATFTLNKGGIKTKFTLKTGRHDD